MRLVRESKTQMSKIPYKQKEANKNRKSKEEEKEP